MTPSWTSVQDFLFELKNVYQIWDATFLWKKLFDPSTLPVDRPNADRLERWPLVPILRYIIWNISAGTMQFIFDCFLFQKLSKNIKNYLQVGAWLKSSDNDADGKLSFTEFTKAITDMTEAKDAEDE